ncbi:caspase family protein [Muricoccus radiodurans]|uniref:caspase family protein n=1 Tax=Muricoccus radiodurans TaxID=2231721 RepID=UPI003CECB353
MHRLLRRLLLLLPLAVLAGGQAPPPTGQGANGPSATPVLRVEAGGHTAPVNRLAIDASGRLLATVADDKTLRLWSLPDGGARSVLRPPIGPGQEGELYAVALTPDGSRVFAAGFTGRGWDPGFCIYVLDADSGQIIARLPNLPAPVLHLAVSPDGTRLAAGLAGRAGLRVWDARSGAPVFEDTGFAGAARMLAFASDNRLAASGSDGRVRIYDPSGRKVADRAPIQGGRPYGLAFSPDGTLLAVGYEDRLRVDLLAATDLRTVYTPDVTGLQGEGLPAVTWARDGEGDSQLHAAGYARIGGQGPNRTFVIRRWADFGLGPPADVPAARDAIGQLLSLPSGGLVFAASDPGWGRMGPDGRLVRGPRPATADFRNTGSGLAVSADGMQVRFQFASNGPALVFDGAAGRLEESPAAEGFLPARTTSPRVPLADWRNTNRPRLGQAALRLNEGEIARSAAILPREDGFVLGTDTQLRLFDAAGRQVASETLPGTAWGLAVSTNGLIAAALGDGTIRWYGINSHAQLEERAALFVHADARRWALWTPEGLFDHAPGGGQELVGVHLNRGRAQSAEWATFQQAYRALYAPAEVRAALAGNPSGAAARMAELGDVRSRIARLPVLRAGTACAVLLDGSCREVAMAPAVTVPPEAVALRLTLTAEDRGLGLGPLDILVNDRIAARGAGTRGVAVPYDIPLDPGSSSVATRLYAEDRALFAEGPTITVRRDGEREPPATAGRLIVLAIGVDQYASAQLNLRFAVADARSVAETLRTRASGLFREVQTILLTDQQASRAGIMRALATVAERARPEDTFVLYMAGHGLRTEPDRRFIFLPADVRDTSNWQALRAAAIEDEALVSALARIRARDGFLFMDTCHSGQLTVDSLAALGNETGRYLLTASTSVQEALDSYNDRNGVFAFAVLEGLGGRAAVNAEGQVSALSLGEFVSRRVPALAAEKRHRQDAVFRSAGRDLRGFPLAAIQR